MQETIGSPSTRTVHAPHSASSQPILVPVRRNRWRRSDERVSPGTGSSECCSLLTKTFMFAILLLLFRALPRRFEDIFKQTCDNMPAVIGAGAASTRTETYFSK